MRWFFLVTLLLCGGLLASRVASEPVEDSPALGILDIPAIEWVRLENGPSRAFHTMIYDSTNQLFWLFGGVEADVNSTNYFNALYRLDATDPDAEWELVQISGLRPEPRVLHSAIYDPVRQRMIVFGGLFDDQSLASGVHVWFLDLTEPANPRWSRVSVTGGPASRFAHAATYVPDYDVMIISAGLSSFNSTRNDNYALLLGEEALRWVRLTGVGMSGRAGHALVYDQASRRLVSYGGLTNYSTINSIREILTLDISIGLEVPDHWVRVLPTPPSRERALMAATFDPVRRLLWGHGGITDNNEIYRDLSVLNLSVDPPTWTHTTAIVGGPLDRFGHAAAWDNTRERIVVQGGSPDGETIVQDSYGLAPSYDLLAQGWTNIMTEDFEVPWPSAGWRVFDHDGLTNGEYFWGETTCFDFGQSGDADAVPHAAGASAAYTCWSPYPTNLRSWMIYGPFNLSMATDAELLFEFNLDSEPDHDYVKWMASTNGTNFHGFQRSGTTDDWETRNFDLTDVPTLGNLAGQSQVWIAFVFESDANQVDHAGVWLDNIVLRASMTQQSCPGAGAQVYITSEDNENNAHTGSPDNDMYPGNSDCIYNNRNKPNCPDLTNPLAPIEFNIFVPSLPSFTTAQLSLSAWDVDEEGDPDKPSRSAERDEVYFNGQFVGTLTGADEVWSTSVFDIDPALVRQGNNLVEVRIDQRDGCWCVSIDWGQLVLGGGGGVASIRSAQIDRPGGCYHPGQTVGVFHEVDTTLSSQEIRVETNILDPNNVTVASDTQTYTIQGRGNDGRLVQLNLPLGIPDGTYKVQVIVFDTCSNTQQGIWTTTFPVRQSCPTVTVVVSGTPSPTRTPTLLPGPTSPTPTRTPTRTITPTPTQTRTPTVTRTSTSTLSPTSSPTPTRTPTATFTFTSTPTPTSTSTPTVTQTPTSTPIPDFDPPTGTITINRGLSTGQGAVHTTSRTVYLSLPASDGLSGVASYRTSTSGVGFTDWLSYVASPTARLPSGDGEKSLFVQFRDQAGNISDTYADSIILDTSAGSSFGLSINGGDLYATNTATVLLIPAEAGTAEMQVSNDGGFQGVTWEPYRLYKDWEITAFGSHVIPRTVYARYRDVAGNLSGVVSDDIILDMTAPSSEVTELSPISASHSVRDTAGQVIPVMVRWRGTDDVSGVKWYDIQVRKGNRAWETWLVAVMATQAIYPVELGSAYHFRSRAQDNAGNVEAYSSSEYKSIRLAAEFYLPFVGR